MTHNTEELDWSLPARLRRIAQVFGDALNVEAADRIEQLERELANVRQQVREIQDGCWGCLKAASIPKEK